MTRSTIQAKTLFDDDISQLQPTNVWQWFAQICEIPHPTFHEKPLGELILQKVKSEGQAYGLTGEMDAAKNILIQKPASPDMQHHAPIAIQAHYDMVAQKGTTSSHDFMNDPIKTIVKEGWVWADDTTLGADNGIGLAMALAVAFSDDISHPPLRLVITSEEEIGMNGVQNVSPSWLDVPYLINLDSEDEGALFVGCAGGRDATFSREFELLDNPAIHQDNPTLTTFRVNVSGLHGGHSGIDIHKGFANANLVLARILAAVYEQSPFYLHSLNGGVLRNVITRDAYAIIVGDMAVIEPMIKQQAAIIAEELTHSEPNLQVEISQMDMDSNNAQSSTTNGESISYDTVVGLDASQKILDVIVSIPNGVLRMSDSFVGVVETSISMGVVKLENGKFEIRSLMRSLAETPKDDVSQRLTAFARQSGISLTLSDDYPGWTPAIDSWLLTHTKPIMQQVFGQEPQIEVIHAGLECGILSGKNPKLDMISFGPSIRAAHSPKERVEIASVAKTWEVLLQLLKKIPQL